MSECNKDLQAAQKAYPRTCAVCGKGKCTKYPDPVMPGPGSVIFLVVREGADSKVATFDRERAEQLAIFGNGDVVEVPII